MIPAVAGREEIMNKMMTSVLALAALAASPAIAADLPVKAPPPPAPPAVYNWTGLYSATVIGGGWEDVNGTYLLPPDRHNTSQSRGWWGSAYGAQYQWNNYVLGIEGAYSLPFEDDYGTSLSPSADCLSTVANRTCESRIRSYWTVGGKLGIAWNNWLLYGTGGYASGRVQTATFITSAP